MTEFKLVPVVPTEAMIDAGRGAGFGAVPSLVEKVYTAILAAAPPSGGNGEPFAWWKQLEMADTGEIVTCYSDDEPETTGWQPLYTAPPRVVDVEIRLLMQNALESLQGYRREMNDVQPCDAEKSLIEALVQTK